MGQDSSDLAAHQDVAHMKVLEGSCHDRNYMVQFGGQGCAGRMMVEPMSAEVAEIEVMETRGQTRGQTALVTLLRLLLSMIRAPPMLLMELLLLSMIRARPMLPRVLMLLMNHTYEASHLHRKQLV